MQCVFCCNNITGYGYLYFANVYVDNFPGWFFRRRFRTNHVYIRFERYPISTCHNISIKWSRKPCRKHLVLAKQTNQIQMCCRIRSRRTETTTTTKILLNIIKATLFYNIHRCESLCCIVSRFIVWNCISQHLHTLIKSVSVMTRY